MEKVNKEICEKGRLIPFDLIGNTICVAMTNVLNRKAITGIEETTGCKVKAFTAPWIEIKKVISAYFDGGGEGIAHHRGPRLYVRLYGRRGWHGDNDRRVER